MRKVLNFTASALCPSYAQDFGLFRNVRVFSISHKLAVQAELTYGI